MYNTLIDVDALIQQIDAPEWVIIDCRFSLTDTALGETKYKTSHIPNAVYAHLDNDLSSPLSANSGRHPLPDKQTLAAKLGQFGVKPDSQIVAYDDNIGGLAGRLWWLCQWLGHERCAVLNGGFAAWEKAQHPVSDTAAKLYEAAEALPIKEPLVDVVEHDKIQNKHGANAEAALSPYLLLDAREAVRYQGLEEPIDRIAGHIPGAINVPFINNVDESGLFLDKANLQTNFEKIIDNKDGKTLVHYCGSGVTAAHNILAMTHAGLAPGALYPGSYSQWTNHDDELCPVVGQHD